MREGLRWEKREVRRERAAGRWEGASMEARTKMMNGRNSSLAEERFWKTLMKFSPTLVVVQMFEGCVARSLQNRISGLGSEVARSMVSFMSFLLRSPLLKSHPSSMMSNLT